MGTIEVPNRSLNLSTRRRCSKRNTCPVVQYCIRKCNHAMCYSVRHFRYQQYSHFRRVRHDDVAFLAVRMIE